MKKLIYFLLLCGVCYWLYNRCSGSDSEGKVVKQVTVVAKVANLRTGPGTNYDVLQLDSASGPYQVERGAKLDVVKVVKGWYEVRVNDRTAYIKQSLCSDGDSKSVGKKKGGKRSNMAESEPAADQSGTPEAESAPSSAPSSSSSSTADEDDFEEEVEEAPFIPYTR